MSPDASGNFKGIAVPPLPWLPHKYEAAVHEGFFLGRLRYTERCLVCGRVAAAEQHAEPE